MKVIGIGLNKTGTKTLGRHLKNFGLKHKTYDLEAFEAYRRGEIDALLDMMEDYDSFEDWPWPLMYREIDARFPDAKFVLTVRRSPDVWYRSLCHMAVRIGPLDEFEQYIYGYAMPQGHRAEHVRFYERHNAAVEAHFADRPGKLLRLCWGAGDDAQDLADFLGIEDAPELPALHVNRSENWVYTGPNRVLAELNRWAYQSGWVYEGLGKAKRGLNKVSRLVRGRS